MHGKDAIVEQILDWRPAEYWLTKTTLPGGPGAPQFLKSEEYTRTQAGGTSLELIVGSVEGHTAAEDEEVMAVIASNVGTGIPVIMEALERFFAGWAATAPEPPELPERRERYLSGPISY
jgi:hypothetical protein